MSGVNSPNQDVYTLLYLQLVKQKPYAMNYMVMDYCIINIETEKFRDTTT